jgi:hypothetical protein
VGCVCGVFVCGGMNECGVCARARGVDECVSGVIVFCSVSIVSCVCVCRCERE